MKKNTGDRRQHVGRAKPPAKPRQTPTLPLLPCPHCGAAAINGTLGRLLLIHCVACPASVLSKDLVTACHAWNRRTTTAILPSPFAFHPSQGPVLP